MQAPLLLFAFSAGVMLTSYIPELPPKEALLAISLLAPCILLAFPRRFCFLKWSILALIYGGVWSVAWGTMQMRQSLPQDWQKQDLETEGYVAGLPQDFGKRIRFVFSIKKIIAPNGDVFLPPNLPFRRAQLSWYDPPPDANILPGQEMRLKVRLRRPHSFMNPAGFDYEAHMFQRKIAAQGYIREPPVILANTLRYPIARLRAAIKAKIMQQNISPQARGLFAALTLGDRGGMSNADRLLFQRNGISHLIAISGMHLSMVGGTIFMVLVFLLGRLHRAFHLSAAHPPLVLAASLTLPLIWFYALMAGFSLPTQRALLMLSVFLVVFIHRHFHRLLTVYAAAMALVLLVNPLAAFGVGFWLSFAAAGFILLTAKKLVGNMLGIAGFVRSLFLLQMALLFCLAPFILFFFYELSLVGFFVNLVAIPLTIFVLMPSIFLTTFLLFVIPHFGELLGIFLAWFLDACYDVLEVLASAPQSYVRLPKPSALALLSALLGIILWLCRRSPKDVVVAAVFFLPLFFPLDKSPAPGTLRVLFLDVGQGLAVHLRTANHHLLYDTGGSFSPRSSAGNLVIVPYLKYLGGKPLDRIIVSHSDRDHSGGLRHILQETSRSLLMLNFPLPDTHLPVLPCYAGRAWRWDEVSFEIVHPTTTQRSPGRNDNSCVLMVTAGNHRLLLTGDITQRVEDAVLSKLQDMQVDVLQVPHHGSKDASSSDFVRSARPDYAVFAAGYLNPYNHPNARVVQRYLSIEATPVILWQTGAVMFELGSEKIRYNKGYRLINKRYWHRTDTKTIHN